MALITSAALALACVSPPPPPQPLVVTVWPVREHVIHPYVVAPPGIQTCLKGTLEWGLVEVRQLPEPDVEQRINAELRLLLEPPRYHGFSIDLCEYYVDFELVSVAKLATVSPGLLSFVNGMAIDPETLPEPVLTLLGINIDFKTGEIIRLEDVFREGSGYRAVLSEHLAPELLSRCDSRAAGLAEEANPGSYDYQNFLVRDVGFEIVFQPEDTDGFEGPEPFTVPVPWSRLHPLLKTEGPVADFVATVPGAAAEVEPEPVVPRREVTCEE